MAGMYGGGGGYNNVPDQQYANSPGLAGAAGYNNDFSTQQQMRGGKANPMDHAFFGAALFVMIGSSLSAIALLFSLEWIDMLEMIYFFIFGGVLAIVDTPVFQTIKLVLDLNIYIKKYFELITRVTGKGVVYIFLGSSLFSSMWANLETGFLLLIAFVLCLFIFFVGVAGVMVGGMKSKKLEQAKLVLKQQCVMQNGVFTKYLITYPPRSGQEGSFTPQEFNTMTMENGGFHFDDGDLKLIFNAIAKNPSWRMLGTVAGQRADERLPVQDLSAWVDGGMVLL